MKAKKKTKIPDTLKWLQDVALYWCLFNALAVFNTRLTVSGSKMLLSALPTEDLVGYAFRISLSALFVVVES